MPNRNKIYHDTNDLVSRDPLIDAYTPALIWNRSYVIPRRPQFDSTDPRGRRVSLDEVRRSVDNAILEFLRSKAGQNYDVDPSFGDDMLLFAGVYDRGSCRQGLKPTARPERDITRTSLRILEADERALVLRGKYASKVSIEYALTIKIHIRTNLFTLSMIATPAAKHNDLSILNDTNDFKYLTMQFWDELSKKILTAFSLRRDLTAPALQGIFADSRGILISSHSLASSKSAHPSFDANICWAEPVIRHLAPILTPLGAKGCTATYMLDKRAVSLTTFGSEPVVQLAEARRPLTFVICIHGDILNQHEAGWAMLMGHVLNRSHTITTMRLAALLDLKLLRAASIALAEVDDLKANARELISRYERDEVEGGPAHLAVDAVRQHLAEINSSFLNANAAGVGLTFRIESSKYYIEEFKKHVEFLRLSPIDGYQSYAQTIDQNVGIIFEFIRRLGARYDRLVSETRSIEQSFSTVQTRHTGNLIAELQRNGEALLIGVLVPYYLIGIASHVLGAPEKIDDQKAIPWLALNAFIFVACLYIAIYRFQVSKYKPTSLKSDVARFVFMVRLAVACLAALPLVGLLGVLLHRV